MKLPNEFSFEYEHEYDRESEGGLVAVMELYKVNCEIDFRSMNTGRPGQAEPDEEAYAKVVQVIAPENDYEPEEDVTDLITTELMGWIKEEAHQEFTNVLSDLIAQSEDAAEARREERENQEALWR